MRTSSTNNVSTTLEIWHDILETRTPSRLEEVLAEDCVFLSPVVHTPQRGRDLTMLYLSGAMQVLNENFHYTKKVISDTHAVLEFECSVDDILINGVDILTFNSDGLICEFRVMVRPLKAINLMHQKMREALESLKA